MPSRLTGMQFQALRSMGHEPWVVAYRHGHHIEWKYKRFGVREWVSLNDSFFLDKVIIAGKDLESMGLAETYERRCCPGTDCHMNDKLMMRLTPKGKRLLDQANVHVQKADKEPVDFNAGKNGKAGWPHRIAGLSWIWRNGYVK